MRAVSVLAGLSRGRQVTNFFDYTTASEVISPSRRLGDLAAPSRALVPQRDASTTEALRPRSGALTTLVVLQRRRLCSVQAVPGFVGMATRIRNAQSQMAVLPTALAVEKMRRQRFLVSVTQASCCVIENEYR
jgi:hypothetical protein